jgi:hypothetical protein
MKPYFIAKLLRQLSQDYSMGYLKSPPEGYLYSLVISYTFQSEGKTKFNELMVNFFDTFTKEDFLQFEKYVLREKRNLNKKIYEDVDFVLYGQARDTFDNDRSIYSISTKTSEGNAVLTECFEDKGSLQTVSDDSHITGTSFAGPTACSEEEDLRQEGFAQASNWDSRWHIQGWWQISYSGGHQEVALRLYNTYNHTSVFGYSYVPNQFGVC